MTFEDDRFDTSDRDDNAENPSQAMLCDVWSPNPQGEAVNVAIKTVSAAVQELPDLLLSSAEVELYSGALAAATVSDDVVKTADSIAKVVSEGAEFLSSGVESVVAGETSLDEFAASLSERARDDAASIFISSGNAIFRSAETIANVVESAATRAVDTAVEGATGLADAGNQALDALALGGVIDPELLELGRRVASDAANPIIGSAAEVLGSGRELAGQAATVAFDAATSAVDVAGQILPDELGGAITTAYDSVNFGRRVTERATNGATDAASRVLGLASRVVNPRQNPELMRRMLRGR